ncbi:MAG: hypothetical protein V3U98_01450 [Acidobacteriota bacterium]
MIGSTVAFLFLVELGVGVLLTLWILRCFELPRSLKMMLAGLAGALVALGLPFGMRALGTAGFLPALLQAHSFWPLVVVAGCAAYLVTLVTWGGDASRWLLVITLLAGVASITAGGLALGASSGIWADLQRSGYFLSAALLLGSTLGAMILGHWYLVDRSMAIEPLRRATYLLLFAVVLRIGVVGGPAYRFLAEGSLAAGESLDLGLFWVQRTLFGLAGPLILGVMIWQTVRLRATQAATGLLYIVLIFVIIGEILSHYLFLKTDRFL